MESALHEFFSQGNTKEYRAVVMRAIECASNAQINNLNKKTMLLGDVITRLDMDEENIYVPKSLMKDAESNKLLFSLLANALLTANEMTVTEFEEMKAKWSTK